MDVLPIHEKILRLGRNSGSQDCLKCSITVLFLENVAEATVRQAYAHDLRPITDFPIRSSRRRCRECTNRFLKGSLDTIGANLVDYHDNIYPFPERLPRHGCSLCLLMLQVKCAQGSLYSTQNAQRLEANLSPPDQSTMQLSPPSVLVLLDPNERSSRISRRMRDYFDSSIGNAESAKKLRILSLHQVDWLLIKSWLQHCESSHTGSCDQQLLDLNAVRSGLRTYIDVKNQQLVHRPSTSRYFALSYVWGSYPQLQLTKANKMTLYRQGSLQRLEHRIPQTIRDAMQVVSQLDEELLWVDSLCIVQDDEIVKHHMLREMASIYDQAAVTIVAAHGHNAGVGLHRVHQNSPVSGNVVKLKDAGLYLIERCSLKDTMSSSVYNTRAWTFQERLLSRRCLYFTSQQVYFECQCRTWSEDRFDDSQDTWEDDIFGFYYQTQGGNLVKKTLAELASLQAKEKEMQMERYNKIVEEYSRKQLTFPMDVLDAFAGISAVMEKLCNWTMVSGLPEQSLDHALLWEQIGTTSIRVANADPQNKRFPTWSWAAWTGGVRCETWVTSDLIVFHSPFRIEPSTVSCSSALPIASRNDLYTLDFSSKVVPSTKFSFKYVRRHSYQQRLCMLYDPRGQCVGTVPGIAPSMVETLETTKLDFVLLSAPKALVHSFAHHDDHGYINFFSHTHPRDLWSIFTVMIVRWDEGVAYRVALAYIHKVPWEAAEPETKDIRLA